MPKQSSGNATLTPKQELFTQGVFKGLSQREAYKQAYNAKNMSERALDIEASRLANNPKVSLRLKELRETLSKRNTLTVEWVLNNLKEVAERCMQAEPVMMKMGDELVETGEYKFEHSGANKSLELIGKHLGMFVDKVESKNTNDNTTTDLTNMTEEERKKRIAELLNK